MLAVTSHHSGVGNPTTPTLAPRCTSKPTRPDQRWHYRANLRMRSTCRHGPGVQESRTRGLLLQEVRTCIHRSMSADNQALIRGHRQAASHRRSTLKNPDSCRCNCRNSAPAGNLEASARVTALAFGIRSAAASEQSVPRPRSSSSSLKTTMDPGKGA